MIVRIALVLAAALALGCPEGEGPFDFGPGEKAPEVSQPDVAGSAEVPALQRPLEPELRVLPQPGAPQTHALADRYRLIDKPGHKGRVRFATPGTRVPDEAETMGPVELVVFGEACALASSGYLIMVMVPCVEEVVP
jgi:hypothetical protein